MDYTPRENNKKTDFSREEIKEYLRLFYKAVKAGKYIISRNQNRKENLDFIEYYRLGTSKQKEILLDIKYDDFCYAVNNKKEGFEHEILYIFSKCEKLEHWGKFDNVDIYIKINMLPKGKGDKFVIVVSFHKRNYPIKYLFK